MSSFLLTFFFQTSILKVVVVNIGRRGKQMKELALYNLKEGMVLAKDITTPSGQVVLEKGKELTKQSILRLSFYNIKSACIVDGEEKQAAPKSYSQKIKTSQKFQSFQVDHTIVLSQIRVSFEGYVNEGRPLDTAALLSKVVELFQSCKTSLELFNMLHNMHSSDDSIYVHSLNVSLICRQKMAQGRRRHFRHADARRTASRHRQAQDSNRASQQTGQIHRRRVRAGQAAHPVRLRTVKAASAGCTHQARRTLSS